MVKIFLASLLVFSLLFMACSSEDGPVTQTQTPGPGPTLTPAPTFTPKATPTAAPTFTPLPPELFRLRSKFGPWFPPRTDGQGRPVYHYTRLLLLYMDGSIEVSAWSMRADDAKWSPSAPREISNVVFDIEAKNVLGDEKTLSIIYEGNKFALGVWQPFALENNPSIIYVFGPDGTLWGVNVEDSHKLRPLG